MEESLSGIISKTKMWTLSKKPTLVDLLRNINQYNNRFCLYGFTFEFSRHALDTLREYSNDKNSIQSFSKFFEKYLNYLEIANSPKIRQIGKCYVFGLKYDPFRIVFREDNGIIAIQRIFSRSDHDSYNEYISNC